jgi:hypothetical protein
VISFRASGLKLNIGLQSNALLWYHAVICKHVCRKVCTWKLYMKSHFLSLACLEQINYRQLFCTHLPLELWNRLPLLSKFWNVLNNGPSACSFCGEDSPDHEPYDCYEVKGCAKCGSPQKHTAQDCALKRYPDYTDQCCDICFTVGHESKYCKRVHITIRRGCSRCGHGDHEKEGCPLAKTEDGVVIKKIGNVPYNLAVQFTPRCYAVWVQKGGQADPAALETSTPQSTSSLTHPHRSALATTAIQSISAQAIPHRTGSASRNPPSTPPKGSPTKHASGDSTPNSSPRGTRETGSSVMAIGREVPSEYEQMELSMPKFVATKISQSNDILANFFQMTIKPNVRLYKYSIKLGLIDKRIPTKRELKHFLVHSILTSNGSRPSHDSWATDYESIVVSAKPLYPDGDLDGNITSKSFPRNTSPTETEDFTCSIRQLGTVNFKPLLDHLEGGGNKHLSVAKVDLELHLLNMITCKRLNDPNLFQGGIVGKKFYPEALVRRVEEDALMKTGRRFMIRPGFFASMRPSVKGLLLNVSYCTSAFYSPMNLKAWMRWKWGSRTPSEDVIRKELKNVKVEILVGQNRQRAISGISLENIQRTYFPDPDNSNRPVSVFAYMERSKSNAGSEV